MSLSISLSSALSGLRTNQAAMQVLSSNISNANTPGYTRKIAQQQTVTLDGSAAGVELSQISRNVDRYLLAESQQAASTLAAIDVETRYLDRIQDLYGQPSSNISLSARTSDFGAALQQLATTPENTALQIDVVNKAVTLAQQVNHTADEVQQLRTEADREIALKLETVNSELTRIAELNRDIARNTATGQPTADLEDLRDQAVEAVARLIAVKTFMRNSGELVVMTPDGRVLADTLAASLSHKASAQLGASTTYPGAIDAISLGGSDITSSISGGAIAGLIALRDQLLPDMQAELDNLSQVLRDEVNQISNAGAGLPPPNTLTSSRSFAAPGSDTISFTADVRIAVVDATGAFVAYTDLAAGSYSISAVDAAINAGLAGFATATTSAGGPLTISAGNPNEGIAIVDLGANTVSDAVGSYSGFSYYFGLNDIFVTPGSAAGDPSLGIANVLQVNKALVADPRSLTRGTVANGTGAAAPAVGDPAIAVGDGSLAQAIADKLTQPVAFAAAGGLGATTTSLTGYGADIVAGNSIKAAAREADADFRRSVLEQLSHRLQSESGVNVDEELANMIIYQNAYAASAQVIGTTQELFDLLSDMVR